MNGSNLPPGVTERDPYFNPPVCPECGETATPGEDCPNPECGEYVPTRADLEDEAADAAFDKMRDDGRI